MKKFIGILFLIPFFGFAQFHLEVTAINLENNEKISTVEFSIGSSSAVSNSTKSATFNWVSVHYLDEVLKISRIGFKFEELPLYQHEYWILGNTMFVSVYGRPWKQETITIDLPIAKSKKVKNDSVSIGCVFPDGNALISFAPALSIEKKRKRALAKLPPFTLPYDELTDGEFVVTYDDFERKFPFRKENWPQVACLNIPEKELSTEKELHLLKLYFQEIESAKRQRQRMIWDHESEIDSLQQEIDELEREIDRLNGVPVAYRPAYPVPMEEPEVQELFLFVNSPATPPVDYETFEAEFKQQFADYSTQYGGNITIEFTVYKDGRIRAKAVHAGSEDKAILVDEIRRYLQSQRWHPAQVQGRNYTSEMILSINISEIKDGK